MKKIKIDIQDLLGVLQAMIDTAGTKEIMIFEFKGMPAICDIDDPDNIVTFQTVSESEEGNEEDEGSLH